ncbi:MAG: leukotriene A4 hydrolase C-terminal domain-containing protein [Acidobacteria bacterium]|nr:leukotriene A4 hydrolase C-terminal domain-containing protein [Acidobacteriota bacterium]
MFNSLLPALLLAGLPGIADPFSHANPRDVAITHLALDLDLDFRSRSLGGQVVLHLARSSPRGVQDLVLDTQDLVIRTVAAVRRGRPDEPLPYVLGASDPVLGAPLRISLPPGVRALRVAYRSGERAGALQWLDGPQTRSGRPFLYTQSGTIHARSWIPLQDSPGQRFTWEARVRVPEGLVPVMSGELRSRRGSISRFRMTRPVPAYLLSLAVGDLGFQAWGPRTGIHAERPLLPSAHREFRDMPRMLRVAERLFGPYRWGRSDLLVMPPAFPYAGVENPTLTFVSPALLVGDRSGASTIAHELAHAWAGNLVTQATWNDVWLNEGLTVYLERRLVEALFGKARAEEEAVLGRQQLLEDFSSLPPADQRLRVDFRSRHPDQVLSTVPYEKGYLFFVMLERRSGRASLDAFLRRLFRDCAFRSLSTSQFLERLEAELPGPTGAWIEEAGLPPDAPWLGSEALDAADPAAKRLGEGSLAPENLPARTWSPRQWAWFLAGIGPSLDASRLGALDHAWHLTRSRNPTVLVPWLVLGVRGGHAPAVARAEEILGSAGGGRTLRLLYDAMLALPDGPARVGRIFAQARDRYHPLVASSLERHLRLRPAEGGSP